MHIIAFDPGGTTGVAVLDTTDLEAGPNVFHIGPREHHLELWEVLTEFNKLTPYVVYETFEFRNRTRDNLELISREYIGVIKLWSNLYASRLYGQSASQGKGFIPDTGPQANNALKKLGWYEPGKKHGMDALRHLVYFLCNGPHYEGDVRQAILEKGFKG